ncbi:MAG: asparaginase [Acidobacteriota bacterium]
MKRVYIANTGGTIGMKWSPRGYCPEAGFLESQMAKMPELKAPGMPEFVIEEFDPLLDSSNMTPRDWIAIGRRLMAHRDDFDGFIVVHGTDTMAYSASALSFALRGLAKPVIFTGSQIPLVEVRSDARTNLVTALQLAAGSPVPEICLFFGNQLFRGNRATKVSAGGFGAFESPNFPALGTAGVDLQVHWDLVLPPEQGVPQPRFTEVRPAKVVALKLFPGMPPEILANALRPPTEGVVLETYGVGNGPGDAELLRVLEEAADRGVVIVNCTQCLYGRVDMEDYATGSALGRAGLTSGSDMTTEAALAKLFYLLSLGLGVDEVRRQMPRSLRGELTEVATSEPASTSP